MSSLRFDLRAHLIEYLWCRIVLGSEAMRGALP
jgi:hypothetical protein